ncbi:SET domain-containing protein [Viridothelium virens]|uniref:SET domain-containing protein n=1 Tax=Viridothelium virens TaxID=1048519 RepID=A0A6A6HFM6_VIRVR|nr:SET domain-containing protein [Viridothelium virens]
MAATPKAQNIISGQTIRKARQGYTQDQQAERWTTNARTSLGLTGENVQEDYQPPTSNEGRKEREWAIVPAASIKRAAFKSTVKRNRTKRVSTSVKSRWSAFQPYQESTDHFENLVEIKQSEGKGRGWFAAQDIPQGTQIVAERSLLTVKYPDDGTARIAIHKQYRRLEASQMAIYDSLSSAPSGDHVVAIFHANSFAWDHHDSHSVSSAGVRYAGVFPRASLLNHDCHPNALFDVDAASRIGQCRAMVNIPAGTEITIRYCDDECWASGPRRRLELRKGWEFECRCETCRSPEREEVRTQLRALVRLLVPPRTMSSHVTPELRIDDPEFEEVDREETLRTALTYVQVMSGEGITGTRMARAYNIAARFLERAGRLEEALEHLRAAQRINANCFGRDGPHYWDQRVKIEELEANLPN